VPAAGPQPEARSGASPLAFEARQVEKTYLGLVAGDVAGEAGTIELALTKISSEQDGWRMVPSPRGKPATTHWQRLMMKDGMTLVRFQPVTGRTHQIRVHALAGLGAPLLGDPTYGKADPRVHRTMLHAAALTVQRGAGKPPIVATAPLPATSCGSASRCRAADLMYT
jgi:tRNA pseudouridine32 synthase/23S rRNA pseudouridine746 synthase